MWIVLVALRRPYTFVVLAILLLIFGPITIMVTPKDIFPNIGIPVVATVWNYTGMAPEDMARAYDTLDLADAHAVIAYYLRHRSEVEEYLAKRERDHAELRRQIEGRPEYQELRARLLAQIDRASSDRAYPP